MIFAKDGTGTKALMNRFDVLEWLAANGFDAQDVAELSKMLWDYSDCPNCQEHMNEIEELEDTISELNREIDILNEKLELKGRQ